MQSAGQIMLSDYLSMNSSRTILVTDNSAEFVHITMKKWILRILMRFHTLLKKIPQQKKNNFKIDHYSTKFSWKVYHTKEAIIFYYNYSQGSFTCCEKSEFSKMLILKNSKCMGNFLDFSFFEFDILIGD